MSSSVPHSELLSSRAGETSPILGKQEQISQLFQGKEEALSRSDDRNGRTQQTVDVAEILRRWTHALQRIHKQSLHLVRYYFICFILNWQYIRVTLLNSFFLIICPICIMLQHYQPLVFLMLAL